MRNIDEYLQNEEAVIRDEIENILRKMCAGMSNREWSDDMIDKLYKEIYYIMRVGEIMKNGFEMGNVWYNEPNSLDTAFDVMGDIILSTAAQQYG